ncbi:MAG TPA: Rid family hydrolase [Flavisolibacter sp.]|nr:Rid family hydrolase [Flavisolibacter sp.]
MTTFQHIHADKNILGGKPCIRGTRITVQLIKELTDSGATVADILAAYPHLTADAIREAIVFPLARRTNYSSGAVWEDKVGYSRAVKVGNHIEVSGTVASDDSGNVVGQDDAYEQTKFILQKIENVLHQAGASVKDVVRTRMFVTDISRFAQYAKAHGEVFGSIKPCTSMLEVKGLVAPEYLIEIEVTAILTP